VLDDHDYDDDQLCTCPKCSGMGSVDCHCGGDLCVCENYGDAECPICDGEGQVSEAIYARYTARQRQMWSHWHITQHYIRNRTAAELHTPGGKLLASDLPHLYRATARDAGVTIQAVKSALGVE
jgi:hypothetical protein